MAGAGTGGTVSGAGKYLKEKNPKIRVIAGDPVGSLYTGYRRGPRHWASGTPYKVEGIGGDKIPTTIWFEWIDEFRQVSDRDAFAMARRLTREEGILVGRLDRSQRRPWRSRSPARWTIPTACVVTILCDTGERYLSKLFNDEWMQENQLLEAPRTTVEQLLAAPAGRRARRW